MSGDGVRAEGEVRGGGEDTGRARAALRRRVAVALSRQDSAGSGSSLSDEDFLFLSVACCDCNGLFPTRSELRRHRVDAHPYRRPHQCPACMATFRTAGLLHEHKRTHTRHRPHACAQCGLRFTLRAHVATHARAAHASAHQCHLCPDKVFQSAGALAAHARSHSSERPFSCPVCKEAAFKHRANLLRHVKAKHPERLQGGVGL